MAGAAAQKPVPDGFSGKKMESTVYEPRKSFQGIGTGIGNIAGHQRIRGQQGDVAIERSGVCGGKTARRW